MHGHLWGIPGEMMIDSGVSGNVISHTLWEQLKKQHSKCVSRRSTPMVRLPLLK